MRCLDRLLTRFSVVQATTTKSPTLCCCHSALRPQTCWCPWLSRHRTSVRVCGEPLLETICGHHNFFSRLRYAAHGAAVPNYGPLCRRGGGSSSAEQGGCPGTHAGSQGRFSFRNFSSPRLQDINPAQLSELLQADNQILRQSAPPPSPPSPPVPPLPPSPPATCTFEDGYDYDHDEQPYVAHSAQDCCNFCASLKVCWKG